MTLHSCRSCFIIVIACCNFSLGLATAYDTLTGPVDDIPLKEDRRVQSHISHSVGCVFGGARYDIDSQWHPILEPYGVMHCLKCTCEAVNSSASHTPPATNNYQIQHQAAAAVHNSIAFSSTSTLSGDSSVSILCSQSYTHCDYTHSHILIVIIPTVVYSL
ncbi:hypothetical protein EB796_010747 [Bugula neritina]|uniref:Uncharacterized protein n=1 Tax=Bugula neritina TaxID=10212 RepID=A0A7J7JYB4_BUGNE|nr:hypothetical protein EB796_010747 [Bugula neritina]